eukprot:4912993-Ditylum_brightwellii.AAC.1
MVVQYWKTKISLQKIQQTDNSILNYYLQKIGADTDVYQGSPEQKPSAQLRKAKKHRKKCCNDSA